MFQTILIIVLQSFLVTFVGLELKLSPVFILIMAALFGFIQGITFGVGFYNGRNLSKVESRPLRVRPTKLKLKEIPPPFVVHWYLEPEWAFAHTGNTSRTRKSKVFFDLDEAMLFFDEMKESGEDVLPPEPL